MDGKAGVRDVTADVDVSFGDIWDNLKFGAMGAYKGTKGRYFVQADVIYMDLSADKKGPNGLVFGDVDTTQTMIEGDFGYSITERIDVFAVSGTTSRRRRERHGPAERQAHGG